jgi:hypothetical protein
MDGKLICKLWQWWWRNYIDEGDTVIHVVSWRSALVEGRGGKRQRIWPCPLMTFKSKVLGQDPVGLILKQKNDDSTA